jgi:hypothetical protein
MLFHKEIGLPKIAETLYGRKFCLTYSRHAQLQAVEDRYGVIDKPPFNLEVTKDNLIELETDKSNSITKVVVRLPYDKTRDVVVAFIPDYDLALVKTIWANLNSDKHFTLRKELYDKP